LNRKAEDLKSFKNIDKDIYRDMAEVCLTQVILFNRKRSREVQRITLEDYEHIMDSDVADEEIVKSVSKFERQLVSTHKRIEIRGKRGSKVPVIFTEEMIANVDILLKLRKAVDVPSDYLFGKPNSQFPIRGSDCLRRFSKESGAKNPQRLTSTKLCKQLATMSQVLGLNEHGQDTLAKFMGHDIRVHRHYYELPENTVQLAKITKVLHALNVGATKYQESDMKNIVVDETGNYINMW
jgi:hypothetical protein